ncbi:hypothetical protein Slin14017_G112620 [Septoria linicola]|nr:hypothetical protein Slin14017_G112620 [Septoria linicola]
MFSRAQCMVAFAQDAQAARSCFDSTDSLETVLLSSTFKDLYELLRYQKHMVSAPVQFPQFATVVITLMPSSRATAPVLMGRPSTPCSEAATTTHDPGSSDSGSDTCEQQQSASDLAVGPAAEEEEIWEGFDD